MLLDPSFPRATKLHYFNINFDDLKCRVFYLSTIRSSVFRIRIHTHCCRSLGKSLDPGRDVGVSSIGSNALIVYEPNQELL
jgi:hypothetical protein